MGVRDEDIRDRVFLFRLHADSALAASTLLSINRKRSSFDVAAMCDGDDGVFLGNQILEPDLGRFLSNLSPPCIAVFLLNVAEFFNNHFAQFRITREDFFQFGDLFPNLFELIFNFLPLQCGQPLELHFENRFRLDLGEFKFCQQALARFRRCLGGTDQFDDLVNVIERFL